MSSRTPQRRSFERARDLERRPHGVVLEVDEHDDVEVVRRPLGELRRREHGVAAVGGDQRVRDGADAAAAPPRRLRVGGDADLGADERPGDVRGVPVAGLDAVVVVAGRHEDDRLAGGRLEHTGDVGRDQRPPREHAEVDGLEVREQGVVALDRHHRLPRLDPVAVVERVDGQRVPVVGAELEDRDRLVHPAEHRVVLLEDLHDDPRVASVGEQRRARVVEVRVRVVALPHLLDGEVEDLGREPLTLLSGVQRHAWSSAVSSRGRPRAPPRRPRAARRPARRSRAGAAARGRAAPGPGRQGGRGSAPSTRRSRSRPRRCRPRRRAAPAPRARSGARAASAAPTAEVSSSGPIRCEPQRSCSFPRGSPCSYVPIEMCSAPW